MPPIQNKRRAITQQQRQRRQRINRPHLAARRRRRHIVAASALDTQQQPTKAQPTLPPPSTSATTNNRPANNNGKKTLQFIHITKNAGTSIEQDARQRGILWGAHFRQLSWIQPQARRANERHHIPLRHYLPTFHAKYDTFAVVRHPYARALSEFYCRWGNRNGHRKKFSTAAAFNVAFRQTLTRQRANANTHHWRPQTEYTHNADGTQLVTHIIRFEQLPHAFNALMQRYGLAVHLTKHANRSTKQYRVTDLDADTRTLLNATYAKDFELLHYTAS